MKKILTALFLYMALSACNGSASDTPIKVDSLPDGDSMRMPSDTVYPKTDTTSFQKAPAKPADSTTKQ